MNKQELIEYLKSLPDNITILANKNGNIDKYGKLDLIIFTEKKNEEFIGWYLAP
ncbi:hypothetical protein [Romboutsia sp.]|uniref:hypothetical protein n=1 Tax=Romboutsia sp. TaxID=1965302 RepID=UPI002C81693A|nr:hypothetical protein [Romboutsia sp.]HSQ89781.1 hypothetical protein [Romboutsia sp.]